MNRSQYTSSTRKILSYNDASGNLQGTHNESIVDIPSKVELIQSLIQMLKVERIVYCHWKSNDVLERSTNGENDLDLLVSRDDIPRFTEILCRLGFKQAEAPARNRLPSVLDYFGYDKSADKLIHVHAHYQLILGHDMTKNYRLPIERYYLNSAIPGDSFNVPKVEFEFIVFVIRMILKHFTWDVTLSGEGALKPSERRELTYLQERVDLDCVNELLRQHLPNLDEKLFNNCIQALQPNYPLWRRVFTGFQLQIKLQANERRPILIDVYLKLWRRASLIIRRRIFKYSPKYRLVSGGAIIAIVGGDGAGKSTAIDGLTDWLSKHFAATQVHMGKPPWSWTTRIIRGILKIGSLLRLYPGALSLKETISKKSLLSPGYPWLLREVCKGRDRYRLHLRARRSAAKGGLVIHDRYPVSQIQIMDGPQIGQFIDKLLDGPQAEQFLSPRHTNSITRFLIRLEQHYYRQIMSPDLLIVLRVDPEIAVHRKTDEDATSVRERSTEVWNINWDNSHAHIVDASQSKSKVLKELKALIWATL